MNNERIVRLGVLGAGVFLGGWAVVGLSGFLLGWTRRNPWSLLVALVAAVAAVVIEAETEESVGPEYMTRTR